MVILLSGGRPLVHLGLTKQTISGPQVLTEEQYEADTSFRGNHY